MSEADPVERVKLGRTNLFVSRIGFGTTSLADMPDTYVYSVGPERAKETVRAIFDGPANFLDWTRGAEICFPNADEAAALTGATDDEAQMAALARHFPLVVVKRGAAGSEAAEGESRWRVPSPAVAAIDTTGAGDAFVAGFLAARLAGAPVEACLTRAVAAGAAATQFVGGRPEPHARAK